MRLATKIAAAVLLLLLSQKYSLYQWAGGRAFAPALPETLLWGTEALYNGFLILASLLVIKDVALLVWFGVKKLGFTLPMPWQAVKILIVCTSLLGGPWSVYEALRVPDVRRQEVFIEGLPQAFDGYRLVQLTDLHIGQLLKRTWLEAVVEKTLALKPDAIVLTGDLVEGTYETIRHEVEPYARLSARDGVWGVTGNHECIYSAEHWIRAFEAMGVGMLENAHHTIEREGARLVIAGTSDRWSLRRGGRLPDLEAALKGAPQATVIWLAHQPTVDTPDARVNLMLSGHTHGGLIAWIKPLVAAFNDGRVHGLYRLGPNQQAYVSAGTGLWTGMSCRVGVPSEITEITLRRR